MNYLINKTILEEQSGKNKFLRNTVDTWTISTLTTSEHFCTIFFWNSHLKRVLK